MIFVDTNVFMYAVGRPHVLQASAQDFFIEANRNGTPLCTSAEVMQELAHVYLPTGRLQTFDATLELLASASNCPYGSAVVTCRLAPTNSWSRPYRDPARITSGSSSKGWICS